MRNPFKKRVKLDVHFMEPSKICIDCGTTLKKDGEFVRGHRGEQNKLGKMVYRCMPCGDKRFIGSINSSPMALAKYWNIYGMSPEDKLKE